MSIVIPCRDDAAALEVALDHVAQLTDAGAVEVIVAARGDEGRTRRAARGRAVLLWPGGSTRAELLNAGAAVARAPILLFLHADSRPPGDAIARIESAFRDSRVLSGAFEHSFSERDWRLRVVSTINRLRYRLTRNYYGDQGQFIRRNVFQDLGGFPPVRLMEDLELSQRLKRLGRTVLIRQAVGTSGRRFIERGVWRTLIHCGVLLTSRALGWSIDRYAESWRGPEGMPPGSCLTPHPAGERSWRFRTRKAR